MTVRTRPILKREITQDLPDNTTGEISPGDVRGILTDMCDSMALLTDLPSAEAAPYITEFSVAGELSPPAGNIGGQTYRYTAGIAHSDRVGAARIVGYYGSNPSGAVTLLKNLTSAEFSDARGSFSLPGMIDLSSGEVYTIRLEVYTTGQTVGADTPGTHQDRRITAHEVGTAAYHAGYLIVDEDDADVSATLARLTGFGGDTATSDLLPDAIAINVPADGSRYHIYLLARDDRTQPAGFTSAGLTASGSFFPAQKKTLGGVDFRAYVLKPLFALTSANNGQQIGVEK